MEWEVGVSRCKLLYVEWINSKVPLYTTDDHIQHPMINHNGKDYKKNLHTYVCVYITKSPCGTAEINTTL